MRPLILAAFALALSAVMRPAGASAEDDLVHITSRVTYDARLDQGPVRVSWDLSFKNNDPATSEPGSAGTVLFYENVTVPVLKGASGVSAVSSSGAVLDVALEEVGRGPTMSARVTFDERVFFGEMYDLHLGYELANVRIPSLLVSPTYVYLPVIAGGDEATVTVSHPSGDGWSVSLEAGECAQDGTTFSCSGEDSGFLAAVLEVSRPDAVATLPFELKLGDKTINVNLSYFTGEEGTAQHLRELATAGLPVIEEQYGLAYPGERSISISQGGRAAVLGYEGLTTCGLTGECQVVVSPAADDVTFLHELAHLWSQIYAERWLSEGFAQMIAEQAAAAMPEGLVQSRPDEREPATLDLRLDEWGSVSSLIGAKESERQRESAGYDLSVRFLYQLRFEVGSDALKRTNAAIATGVPADSRRYLDVLEETSEKRLDDLFTRWVFPDSFKQTLNTRRQARDRFDEVTLRTAEAGLSEDVPNAIRKSIEAWQFEAAFAALDDADRKLGEYEALRRALDVLTQRSESAGLKLPSTIAEEVQKWEFPSARLMFADAAQALEAYVEAEARLGDPRSVWERFGMLGKDPKKDLQRAAAVFAGGDFESAKDHANSARDAIDDASGTAFRRLLILALLLGLMAAGIAASAWFSRRREVEIY
jgi:hypothetical protein